MKCVVEKNQLELASSVELAHHLFKRMKGLMFRPHLPNTHALLLEPCPQVHTCFMRFAIDVVFLDKDNVVVGIVENMPPWRISPLFSKARRTLELAGGKLGGRLKKGDKLLFI